MVKPGHFISNLAILAASVLSVAVLGNSCQHRLSQGGDETKGPAGTPTDSNLYPYYELTPRLERGDTLWVLDRGALSGAEVLMISTLMGVLAQDQPRIFLLAAPNSEKWLEDMVREYGIVADHSYRSHPWGLVQRLVPLLDDPGYLLCRMGESSVNVATSLAGVMGAVAVDERIEAVARAAGFSLKLDVRGKDEPWCFREYWDRFNHGLLVQQMEANPALRDFGPMMQAFTFYDGNSSFMRQVMAAADDDAPILGWGDASSGEDNFVRPASERSVFTVAADHGWNLSVYSALHTDSLRQGTHISTPLPLHSAHTVTFLMSDGDNLQWIINDFSSDQRWFGSPRRGSFNMGWTIPPSMVALAPAIMARLYRDAAEGEYQDFFVCGVSGGGYLYPSFYPALDVHCSRLNEYLQAADLNIVTILERRRGYFTPEHLAPYTAQPQVIGCLYLDYGQYDFYEGQIVWSNEKPVVSTRFNLWDGFDSPASIAAGVNAAPRDPGKPESYSLVNVHPWSRSLEEVAETIARFDEDVEVVTPEAFIMRIAAQVTRDAQR